MKRSRFGRRGGLTRDAEQLVRCANSLSQSGSRTEDAFWEHKLSDHIDRLLTAGNDDAINAALDELYRAQTPSYGELADLVEARAESVRSVHDGILWQSLLLAIPVLAWSRYSIPAGMLTAPVMNTLKVHLQAHVLGADTSLALADFLFSPDQLPQSYAETHALTTQLAAASIAGSDLPVDSRRLPETAAFLSDMRYLLAVVSAPADRPLFRWQETDGARDSTLARWREQGGPSLQGVLAGCSYDVVCPDAYHAACREADRQLRPYSLRASVAFLQVTLDAQPSDLRAVVAPFAERRLEEYRVGFTRKDSGDVLHGVVWPLLDADDESSDCAGQIESVLREAGVGDVVVLEHQFPLEYCDDCGAPLYPDSEGHAVHAELPETADQRPAHLH